MQMTDEHWCKMAKKSHPFGSWIWTCATWGKQKSDEFLSKALPLSHGGFLQYMCRNSKFFANSINSLLWYYEYYAM